MPKLYTHTRTEHTLPNIQFNEFSDTTLQTISHPKISGEAEDELEKHTELNSRWKIDEWLTNFTLVVAEWLLNQPEQARDWRCDGGTEEDRAAEELRKTDTTPSESEEVGTVASLETGD